MAWPVTADLGRFEEAIAWFRQRTPLTHDEVGGVEDRARMHAFWLAGGVELSAVQTVFDGIADALEKGTSVEDFKRSIREKLGDMFRGYHLETVFRNATQAAYNTGRWYQMQDPDVRRFRPFFMYDAILDSRTTPICTTLNGTVKAADDEFWLNRWPPLHHRCRSSVRSLRRTEAERRGITQGNPDTAPQLGFGLAPPSRGGEPPKPDLTKHDPAVVNVHRQREQQMQRELEEAQRKARADREKQDPKYWLDREFREKYGEDAGRSVAWGRAMEERGRAVSLTEARRQYDELQDDIAISLGSRLTPLFTRIKDAVSDGFIPRDLKTLGEVADALGKASARTPSLKPVLDEVRALAAVIGHRSGIKAAGANVRMAVPRLHADTPASIKDVAREIVDKVWKFWSELSDRSLVLPDKRKGYRVQWTNERAWYDPAARIVYTDWRTRANGEIYDNGFSIIVHEMGHGLEHHNDRTRRAAQEFLVRRTAGERAGKLSDITGNKGYGDDEVSKKDRFFDAYMGKEYLRRDGTRHATEVTSMVLEYLHRNAAKLVDADEESFWFALGQLAGDSV